MTWKIRLLLVVLVVQFENTVALNAVYVNNHKIDKYDVDKIKLLSPTQTTTQVTKDDLITKDNFTNPLHYYQYLVGNDPAAYVDLLWGNNKTHLPSIFRSTTTEIPAETTITYADDLSSVENTLNNTTPIYKGDYHVAAIQQPLTTTKRPIHRIKKPKTKPEPAKNETKITKETLELLRKYFTINCTLVSQKDDATTPLPKVVTTKKPKSKKKPSTTTKKPPKAVNKLHKVKKQPFQDVVYVDVPVLDAVGGILNNVYNYMEDAFVSKEYVSVEIEDDEGKTAAKAKKKVSKKIKRNSVRVDSTTPSAFTSKQYQKIHDTKRVTITGSPSGGTTTTIGGQPSKNKLTTNIHVTSEYTPATQATVPLVAQPLVDDKDGSSEESGSDEADYYEGFSNTSYEEEEEDEDAADDSQEGDESAEYEGSEEATGNQAIVNDKEYEYEDESGEGDSTSAVSIPSKVKKQKKPASVEEYSDEDADDYDSEEEDTASGGSFFSGIMSTIGRFVRSLGFGPRTAVEYDDYDESSRSTTPRILDLRKRPTRSTDQEAQTQIERINESTEKQQPWYHYPPYLFNEIDEQPELQLPEIETNSITEGNSFTDWFHFMTPWEFFNPWTSWDDEQATTTSSVELLQATTAAPPPPATTESSSGWLPNLFGGNAEVSTKAPKPTTPKPLIPFLPASDPLQKPETWLNVIAQHVFTTTRTPKTTTAVASTTHLTKPTKVHYGGYQLWRIFPRSDEHVRSLEEYRLSPEGVKLQWWKGPSLRGANDILVPPHMLDTLAEYLQDEGMSKEVAIRNLGQAIQYENPKMTRREQIEVEVLNGHSLTWYRYHRYGDMVKFMNYLGRKFPKNVELIHIGRSFEGRPLTVVKVVFDGKRSGGEGKISNSKFMKGKKVYAKKKKGQRGAVFIEAGAHGREWIGPSVATWILDFLTKTITHKDIDMESIKSMDWYVLPVMNPDGYEYSHEYDRLWRKTRSRHQETQSSGILTSALNWLQSQTSLSMDSDQNCYGTDLNRNWDHRWNEDGASKSACSEYYSGYKAFSEPESRALSKFLSSDRRNIQIFLSLHSYGQTISYPDGKRSTEGSSQRFSDVHEMAAVAVEALRGTGSHASYQVDTLGQMNYASSGTSAEYAKYEAGIKYSYAVDLPDTGTHGYLLPPSGIESTAKDTFELIKGMVDYI